MANPIIIYSNILSSGVTATSTETDYSVDNIYDLRPYMFWKATSNATQYITMDYGSATSVDSLAISGHDFGTQGSDISVESSPNNSDWTERMAAISPSDDTTIGKIFTTASVRYWRVKIDSNTAAPKAGVIILGAKLLFPKQVSIPHTLLTSSIEADDSISKSGHLLGATYRYSPLKINPTFKLITESFVTGSFKTFWDDHGKLLKPFVWVLNTADSDYDQGYFVRLDRGSTYTNMVKRLGRTESLSLRMVGVSE